MKKMFIGLGFLMLVLIEAVMVWRTGWPIYASVIVSALLWISAGIAGWLLPRLGEYVLMPKLDWDMGRILGVSCLIAAGPFFLLLISVWAHPYFLRNKDVRHIFFR